MNSPLASYSAFDGDRHVASGDLPTVARAAKLAIDRNTEASIQIFDDATGGPVELDFRGSLEDVQARLPTPADVPRAELEPAPSRGPGRPKLGVVAREVTLLPRHWEWLAQQAGGASVAIRKLVEQARRSGEEKDGIRRGQEAAYRFMSAMAGNQPHFEEATRALLAPDPVRFTALIAGWPSDLRTYAAKLAERAFHREARSG